MSSQEDCCICYTKGFHDFILCTTCGKALHLDCVMDQFINTNGNTRCFFCKGDIKSQIPDRTLRFMRRHKRKPK